ncbi:MAG: hypothetical protein ABSG67_07390 [Thermoguttaceae bacterium]|jgi:hypothetical protein
MDDLRIDTDDAENPEEGYPLAPSPPAKEIIPQVAPRISFHVSPHDPPPKTPFQYTLADIFALTTGVAVFMSILKFFPLHTIAGVSGLGALFSLLLLIFWPPERPLLRLGWWVLFALYLLACIGAIIFKR